MQPRPKTPIDGVIEISASNRAQARGPHGAFRYFGKLAPDVTSKVLDLAAEHLHPATTIRVVDVMCGSGTTLVEAAARDWCAVGLDVNPVALLYTRAKSRAVDHDKYLELVDALRVEVPEPTSSDKARIFGQTRNAERWFSAQGQHDVAAVTLALDRLPASRERLLLKAVLLSRLRRISNASARTGRLFFDPESAVQAPLDDFLDAAKSILDFVPRHDLPCDAVLADARAVPLGDASADIVFCHPPYFALYRFSADVLRFEMEVGGFSRSSTARAEVREGWKSGDPRNLDGYLLDMRAVFSEASRILRPDRILAVVASNSTLGDHELPVIDGLVEGGADVGLLLERHYERKAHHGSASYHRSARTDKVIQQDHVLLMRRPH